MKTLKQKLKNILILTFALMIVSLGTIKMFEEVEYQTLKTKHKAVMSIFNWFEQPETSLVIKKVEAKEQKKLTTEERYWKAIKEDVGFREYIVNMIVKRNNPGNLRCANQPHSTCEGGFAVFQDTITGFRALIMQLELDASRGDTIATLIEDFAPIEENNTDKYIADISSMMGVDKNTALKNLDILQLSTKITACEHSIFY